MGKALIALGTDHIKEYVFVTDRLKIIRGASSLLDYFNREIMKWLADKAEFQAKLIYANGGSGLFVIDEEKAEAFGKSIQLAYREKSGGTASITYAVQPILVPEQLTNEDLMKYDLTNELRMLQYRLLEAKDNPPPIVALPSHALMHLCDACGIEYAEWKGDEHGPTIEGLIEIQGEQEEEYEEEEEEEDQDKYRFYCKSCVMKYKKDQDIKKEIKISSKGFKNNSKLKIREGYLWNHVIGLLHQKEYEFPTGNLPRRPNDFSVFREFASSKGYLGLIYADGNGIGKALMEQNTLAKRKLFSEILDTSVYEAMSIAIQKHLPIVHPQNLFPFDILLVGGDDLVIVTPASNAPDVALTILQEFQRLTKAKDPEGKGYTLSVGIVLAPIKYPFGLLEDLAEGTLKFAKKHSKVGESRINFVTVTGSISQNFDKVYQSLSKTRTKDDADDTPEFYATLRPYDIDQFNQLLGAIRRGHELGLGRTKLHQLREAILKRNLTTSVNDALAVLRNWRKDQREYIVKLVYTLATQHQEQHCNPDDPSTWFPRVTFPWFADSKDVYRTTLLDFIELYDFVAGKEVEDNANEA